MIKLILCEGKTDAILLGYYLECIENWKYTTSGSSEFILKVNEASGESATWYNREKEYLLICSVGGKNNFGKFYNKYIKYELEDGRMFNKIAVIVDRDKDNAEDLIRNIRVEFNKIINNVEIGKWVVNYYVDEYNNKNEFEFLFIIVPHNQYGSFENLLLQSIKEKDEGEVIVEDSVNFVEVLSKKLTKYLTKNRIKLKAYLGVTLAILSPEKTFSVLDEVMKSVKWEESNVISEVFNELRNI